MPAAGTAIPLLEGAAYPESKPFDQQTLKVSGLHTIQCAAREAAVLRTPLTPAASGRRETPRGNQVRPAAVWDVKLPG